MKIEIERKYPGASLARAREILTSAGAVSLGARFERNLVFEGEPSLIASKKLLRLRVNAFAGRRECVLTLKAPAFDAEKGYKARVEIESLIGDPVAMIEILRGLSFYPFAVYEKFREPWRAIIRVGDRELAGEADLDLLPFGEVIELEGEPEFINALEALLGLKAADASDKTYHDLHREWLAARGVEGAPGFAFSASEREDAARKFGLTDFNAPEFITSLPNNGGSGDKI